MLRVNVLYRYIFSEILAPFFVSLFVFTGILFLARIVRLFDLVINKSVPIGDMLLLFSYVIPRFLEFAVPMSLLIGVISAFGRMSADSELVVMRATGLSLRRLGLPVFGFSALALLLTLGIGLWLRPWANHQLGVGLFEIAKQKASSGLVPGVFNDLGQLTLYAQGSAQEGRRLENVIISDERDPNSSTVFLAKFGDLISNDTERTITLRLYDGSIHRGSGINYELTYFDINNINLSEEALVGDQLVRKGKKANEMFFWELEESIAALAAKRGPLAKDDIGLLARYKVEWHRRFAVPFACICVAFVAMALGIQPSRGAATWGQAANVTSGIVVIILYYLLLAFATALGKRAVEPIWLFMWIPNVIFSAIAIWLFQLMGSERWLAVSQSFGRIVSALSSKLNAHTSPSQHEA